MFDFHEKRKLRMLVYSKPTLILLGLVVLFLAYSVWGVYEKERETSVKKNQRGEVLETLEEREASLEEEVDRLSSERGIEEEIRSKFDVAKEGEEVIVIVDAPQVEAVSPQPESSLVDRFLNIFR